MKRRDFLNAVPLAAGSLLAGGIDSDAGAPLYAQAPFAHVKSKLQLDAPGESESLRRLNEASGAHHRGVRRTHGEQGRRATIAPHPGDSLRGVIDSSIDKADLATHKRVPERFIDR